MPSNKVNLETLPVASPVPTSARQSHPMRCRINHDALFEKAVKFSLGRRYHCPADGIERLRPPLKSRDEPVLLPFPEGASWVEKSGIIQATAQAEIPADTAAKPLQVLTSHAKLIETEELSRRIEALEAHLR